MSFTPIISLRNIHVQFGLNSLFKEVTLNIYPRDRIALIGRNGSGKTTLFKTLMGLIEPDYGEVFLQPGVKMGYLPQKLTWTKNQTALEKVLEGVDQTLEPEKDLTYIAKAMLNKFGASPDLVLDNASGGERRRVALAYAFASNPDVILMDEPTNHLDIATIEFLEKEFISFKGAIVVISHDRAFLTSVSSKTWWLDRKNIKELTKGFGHFETWSTDLLEQEEKAIARMDKKLDQEAAWLHRGVTARRKRNQGRLARLHQLRAQRAAVLSGTKKVNMSASEDETSGRLVIEAKSASKSFASEDREKIILKPFSTKIMRGDRIGIFGPNGCGKSTLVQLLLKKITPTKGSVRLGANLSVGYFEQNHHDLKDKETLWSTLCPHGGDHLLVGGRHRHVVAYLKDFLFDIDQVRSPVGSLSGGEKNRLALSRILAQNTNILVLDEPTNDLDSDTLDLLVDILSDYEGTLIVVSHDRDFLDRLVTSTISILPGGEVMEFAGGYSDFMWQIQNGEKNFLLTHKEPAAKKNKPKPKLNNSNKEPKKFGFKQQHALKELTNKIEALKLNIKACEHTLADANLFKTNPEKFHATSSRLESLQEELVEAEEQWLELELLREEAE